MDWKKIVTPFKERRNPHGVLESGYADGIYYLTCGRDFYLFVCSKHCIISPKICSSSAPTRHFQRNDNIFILLPGQAAIVHLEEQIKIPANTIGIIKILDEYINCGLTGPVLFLKPAEVETVKMVISNPTSHSIAIHPGEAFASLWLLQEGKNGRA